MSDAYQKLKQQMLLGARIAHIKNVLSWDLAVNMPAGAEAARALDMATLTALTQEGMVNPEMKDWLDEASEMKLGEWDARNLERIREKYEHSHMLPTSWVRQRAEKKAQCQAEYKTAKEANSWKHIEPFLEQSFAVYLSCAKIASDHLGIAPYDYQLQRYAGGNSMALIDSLFGMLKKELPPLVSRIAKKQTSSGEFPEISMDPTTQMVVARHVINAMGFNFNHGTIGFAQSAFSSGWRQDARIATRFVPGTLKTIFSAIHEAGHAIYKQNLPKDWEGQPVGGDSDISIHESQSLFYEKQVGFSRAGLSFIYKTLVETEPNFQDNYSREDFISRLHHVSPSLIRIHADEVTYPLHIIMRYEIERDLFAEKIKVKDIREVWNEKVKTYFGLDVPSDNMGCLQDIHWFKGKFGYFPTYAQGAMYAAQLYTVAQRELDHPDEKIATGNIMPMTKWLNEKIHRWGQFYEAPELIAQATGDRPNAQYFMDHLNRRYLGDTGE